MDLTSRQLLRRRPLRRRDYDGGDPDIRHNPMRFVTTYDPERAQGLKWSRAVRSMVSPALQRKNVERMANSPHNFVVMLRDDYPTTTVPPIFPDAVTLAVSLGSAAEFDDPDEEERGSREGLYTAFTYLHRFGDVVGDGIMALGEENYLLNADKRPKGTPYGLFYKMFDDHLALLEKVCKSREEAFGAYKACIQRGVNSKMVREGYSSDWTQAFADLFPLCELTPSSRPLLLPVDAKAARHHAVSPRVARVFNTRILPDFNVRFRAFYNDLVPRFYGEAVWA